MKRVFTKPVMRFKRIAMLLLLIATATLTMSSACSRDDDDANNGITNNNGTVNYSLGNYHPAKKIKSISSEFSDAFFLTAYGPRNWSNDQKVCSESGYELRSPYQQWEWDGNNLAKISFYRDKVSYNEGDEPLNTIIITYGDNGRIVKAKWEDDNDVGTEMHFVYEPGYFHSEVWRNNSSESESDYVWFNGSGEVRGIDLWKESQWNTEPMYEFVVSNGNITSEKYIDEICNITYDNGINPFKDMVFRVGSSGTTFVVTPNTIAYMLGINNHMDQMGPFHHESFYLNRNNMTLIPLKADDYDDNGRQPFIRIDYEYTADDYPRLIKYYYNDRHDAAVYHDNYLTVEIEYY